ncbi:hypothetical protein [Occallatibacter riparius]|uniref:Uncharacterized protein n=1 Tax=Occallatibacter riparius TaxID=1002689 RepID=A0A9J7BNJ9_9BACT|nr:hypothetical protein [Occallatibacter riparius]UWZ82741.1 hypothetical protein MOP44_19480 [Occallatibacter riparius]
MAEKPEILPSRENQHMQGADEDHQIAEPSEMRQRRIKQTFFRSVFSVSFGALAIWGFNEFLQTRGYQSKGGSRVFLALAWLGLVLLCLSWLYKRRYWKGWFIGAVLATGAIAFLLDRSIPMATQPSQGKENLPTLSITGPPPKPSLSQSEPSGPMPQSLRSTRRSSASRLDDAVRPQMHLYKPYDFSPPQEGQEQRVNVYFENLGPSTVDLSMRGRVTVAISDSDKPIPSNNDNWLDLQEHVWRYFAADEPQNTNFNMTVPPGKNYVTIKGNEKFSQQTAQSLASADGRVIAFILGRFKWRGPDRLIHTYEFCSFTLGHQDAIFNCNHHNGPTPKAEATR